MKKLISLILVVILFAAMTVSTSATIADRDSDLVVFYDFNGATPAEQLQDKAPAGSVADNLVAVNEAENFYTYNTDEGTVRIAGPAINATLKANVSADLTQTGAHTVYVRFKIHTPSLTEWLPIFDMRGMDNGGVYLSYHANKDDATDADNFFAVKCGNGNWQNYYVNATEQWVQLVAVVTPKAEGGFVSNMWICVGGDAKNASEYTHFVVNSEFGDLGFNDKSNLRLGGSDPNVPYTTIGNISYDELRVYKAALSMDEVVALSPSNKVVETEPVQTEAPNTQDPSQDDPAGSPNTSDAIILTGICLCTVIGGTVVTVKSKKK